MKWRASILVALLLCVQSGVLGISLFNFWSHILPGSRVEEQNSVVSNEERISDSVEVDYQNVTITTTTTPIPNVLLPKDIDFSSSEEKLPRITELLNPMSWFKKTKKENSFEINAELGTPEIIRRYGYPAETHTVETEDGYLLNVHRIPCGRAGWTSCLAKGRGHGQAVFIQHGLLGSSADWVITGPNASLAFLLADLGYDVWLGNCRGNTYSNRHTSWSKSDKRYWDYSFHEMAMHDVPAVLDYILDAKATEGGRFQRRLEKEHNQQQVIYVGHSMGTSMMFAMLSLRPEYNDKVKAMFALAPVAYMRHIKSPIRILAPFSKDFSWIMRFFGNNELLPQSKMIRYLAKYGCELTDAEKYICENSIFVLCGFDKAQYNEKLTPVVFAHTPAGTSIKTIVHYAQEIHDDGLFKQFDYGRNENQIRYGQAVPPQYPVENITTPISLIYASNDWLAGPEDVQLLNMRLKNSMGMIRVPFDTFNHLDFMWGLDAKTLVYNDLIKRIEEFRDFKDFK